jgi:hypothetical protein
MRKGQHQSVETTVGRRRFTIVFAIAGLMAFGIVIQAGGSFLKHARVIATPQQYVALALNNPASLPTQVAPHATVHFSFVISNTRTNAINQKWIVTLSSSASSKQVLTQGKAKIEAGKNAAIPVSFTMPNLPGVLTLSISAPGQGIAPLQFHVTTGNAGVL